MCGICGVVNCGDSEVLSRMTDHQAHRGPDDRGIWERRFSDGTYFGLGSRRLAIIDLSSAGHMPMSNRDGTVWITYNGEVYNFRALRQKLLAKGRSFRSNTDTEVILHLYEEEGPRCVRRLNGMFAFAICDCRVAESPTIFLARDHFGVKPLYYVCRGSQLAFASEAKALLELPDVNPRVNLEALNQYMTFLWVPDPLTLFDGIYKLLPGHYAVFQDGKLEVVQYWDLTFPPADFEYPHTEADLAHELCDRLRQSVQRQMISDVPIGAFLSAGMDSSAIVAMMAQATDGPVRTFTITFPPKHRLGAHTMDDPRVAARTAQRFGCDHHEIVVEPKVVELMPRLVWHMDEPTADPALIMAYLVASEARRDVTVLLSGVGGDELFAGYRKHLAYLWSSVYRRIPAPLRRGIFEPGLLAVPSMRGTRLKGLVRLAKKMARSGSMPPREAFLANATYLDRLQRAWLYSPEFRVQADGYDPWERHLTYFDQVANADFINQMLYLDTKVFMVSLNLTYNDKMTMASSVEGRVPFLDWELAEWVAQQVPPRLKLKGLWRPTTKYIFRKAMEGILPTEVLSGTKAGFGAPVDAWLAEDLREMIDDLLSGGCVQQRGYFRPEAVHQMVKEQRTGRRDWSFQIWQLLTLELWLQTFIDRK